MASSAGRLSNRRRFILIGAGTVALLIVGAAAGIFAERARIFGYHSYLDCVYHEAMKARASARQLAPLIREYCSENAPGSLIKAYDREHGPWEKYQRRAAEQAKPPN